MKVEQEVEICTREKKERMRVCALFNTEAVSTFIDEKIAKQIGEFIDDGICDAKIDGVKMQKVGSIIIQVVMEGCELREMARIIRNLNRPLILGIVFMGEYSVKLKDGIAKLEKVPPEMSLPQLFG